MTNTPQELLVYRPAFQLRSLPIPMRWEVTRRHPYYLISWKLARDAHQEVSTTEELEKLMRQLALAHLSAIGVSGEPPDPAIPFSELGAEQIDSAWLSGAVHPITMRGLASILMAGLPQDLLFELSELFLQASRDATPDGPPPRMMAMQELAKMQVAELDCYLDEPFVSINPAASGRQIKEAINKLLSKWKAERQLQEQRDRSDKYPDYLAVWDRREGWTGAGYDSLKEKSFASVGAELGLSVSTVESHYLRAFELVTGHSYSRDLWYKLFLPLKFGSLFGLDPKPAQVRHPLLAPTRRPIPESGIVPCIAADISNPLTGGRTSLPDGDAEPLIRRIRAGIERGMTDQGIADDLGLNDTALPAIAWIRKQEDLT